MPFGIDPNNKTTERSGGGKNRWEVHDFLNIGLMGFPGQGMISIDVTHRCNLSCRHCYFKNQGYRSELTSDQWISWLEDRRAHGYPFLICGWLGGEPLLRRDLLEKMLPYFKSNIIFTNGTSELGQWPECTFVVSVPALRDQYASITQTDIKTFDKVRAHADRPDLRVFVSFCITRPTMDRVQQVLEAWARTSVRGVYFEFYTPTRGDNLRLWVDWKTRDRIISQLLQLKKTYGDFIANTYQELALMKSAKFRFIVSHCPFHGIGASFDPLGQRKFPCAVGPEADCAKCGCILPAFAQILSNRRFMAQALWNGIQRELRERRRRKIPGHWNSVLPSGSRQVLTSKIWLHNKRPPSPPNLRKRSLCGYPGFGRVQIALEGTNREKRSPRV